MFVRVYPIHLLISGEILEIVTGGGAFTNGLMSVGFLVLVGLPFIKSSILLLSNKTKPTILRWWSALVLAVFIFSVIVNVVTT